ncbi:hypothetical protein WH47_11335 [Habropoda laboriosa]|uniref:Uncharacterized protein n=1 Tax=Habropoda laboriosa TaxID=597456 RepID=A0A0L7QLS0_9HYME|nr:hypothetical protein WH47_11335 [Habropoda laboriosa]
MISFGMNSIAKRVIFEHHDIHDFIIGTAIVSLDNSFNHATISTAAYDVGMYKICIKVYKNKMKDLTKRLKSRQVTMVLQQISSVSIQYEKIISSE